MRHEFKEIKVLKTHVIAGGFYHEMCRNSLFCLFRGILRHIIFIFGNDLQRKHRLSGLKKVEKKMLERGDSLFFTTLPLKNTSYSTESLYLWAEDLAEGHILEIQGRAVGDGCADPGGPGGGTASPPPR